jgi:hypothetical protein
MSFLSDVAGEQSALGLYDIGKLQLVYVTHLPSASAMKSGLWQQRGHFETRETAGQTFYVRTDPKSERVVAFAVAGDYLILGTREDLVAGTLALLANQKGAPLSQQGWFVDALKAAKDKAAKDEEAGTMRLIVHLAAVTKTPQFRTYWVQRNITEMRQYESSVSDLFLSGSTYREERALLLQKAPDKSSDSDGAAQVAELMRLVPGEAGFYRAAAGPPVENTEDTFALLEQNVLTPRLGPAPVSQLAPSVEMGEQHAGSKANLDVRIDAPPSTEAPETEGGDALKDLLKHAGVKAALEVQRSEAESDGIFVRLHSTIVLRGTANWDEAATLHAIQQTVSPGLTAANLGAAWKRSGTGAQSYSELDGLLRIAVAVKGDYLFASDDPEMLEKMLARMSQPVTAEPAIYYAGFDHSRERQNFYRLSSLVDRPSRTNSGGGEPQFFSQNAASLSQTLAAVKSETMISRRKDNVETQTVRYEWSQ